MITREELAASAAAQKATASAYASSGVAFVGGLSANEIAAYGGLVLGLLTFVVNSYFRWREFRLKKEQMARGQ